MSFSARNMQLMVALAVTMLLPAAFGGALGQASSESPPSADFLGVGVFYYVWYGTPEIDGAYMHWNHSILPHWNAHIRTQHAGRLAQAASARLTGSFMPSDTFVRERRRLHTAFRYSRSGEHRKFQNHFSF